jgi:carbon monoxide dehydrogenase subunit G
VKVTGSATLHATPEQVWAAFNDPAVLAQTIPGCQQLQALGPDQYRMTVTAGVASIKGTYLGDVALADHVPHTAFTLRASGSGAPGTISADVKVALGQQPDGTTLVQYTADAVVGGAIGGVGQRVLGGVARKLASEFFSAVDTHLTAAPAVPGMAVAPASPGISAAAGGPGIAAPAAPTVFTKPSAPPGRKVQVDVRNPLPAALAGAAIALIGVLVGWRIARRP